MTDAHQKPGPIIPSNPTAQMASPARPRAMQRNVDLVGTHVSPEGRQVSTVSNGFRQDPAGVATPKPATDARTIISSSPKSSSTNQSRSTHMCQVCNKKSPLDKQSLIGCSSCRRRYHKGCHKPTIIAPFTNWKCNRCVGSNGLKRKLNTSNLKDAAPPSPKRLKSGHSLFAVANEGSIFLHNNLTNTPEKNIDGAKAVTKSTDQVFTPVKSPTSVSKHAESGKSLRSTRPDYPYQQLAAFALLEAPDQRLKVGQIHEWVAENIPGYSLKSGENWKTGISHSLSSYKTMFERRAKDTHDASKGGWWTLRKGVEKRLRRWDPSMTATSPKSSIRHAEDVVNQEPENRGKSQEQTDRWLGQSSDQVDYSFVSNTRSPSHPVVTSLGPLHNFTAGAGDGQAGNANVIEPQASALDALAIVETGASALSPRMAAFQSSTKLATSENVLEETAVSREPHSEHEKSVDDNVSDHGAESMSLDEHELDKTKNVLNKPGGGGNVPQVKQALKLFFGGSSPLSEFTQTSTEKPPLSAVMSPRCVDTVSRNWPTSPPHKSPPGPILRQGADMIPTSAHTPRESPIQSLAPDDIPDQPQPSEQEPDWITALTDNSLRAPADKEDQLMNAIWERTKPEFNETSASKVFPTYTPEWQLKEERATEEKIKEIKARPTRKQVAGKPWLSRVKGNSWNDRMKVIKLGRQRVGGTKKGPVETRVDSDGETTEIYDSLEEMLDLPERMVPMIHENQLAFRDLTPSATGKLGRPKVIYKVGQNAK